LPQSHQDSQPTIASSSGVREGIVHDYTLLIAV
jgi:hypothetical protein